MDEFTPTDELVLQATAIELLPLIIANASQDALIEMGYTFNDVIRRVRFDERLDKNW